MATSLKRNHESWKSFKQNGQHTVRYTKKTIHCGWRKVANKAGTQAPSQGQHQLRCIPLVWAHCVPVARVSAPAAAELLPVSPSAGTRPKKLKATLLLQSWWPAGRFKCLKSACRAALLDLLGCFSLAGPPFPGYVSWYPSEEVNHFSDILD